MNEVERLVVRRIAIKVKQRQDVSHAGSIGQQTARENAASMRCPQPKLPLAVDNFAEALREPAHRGPSSRYNRPVPRNNGARQWTLCPSLAARRANSDSAADLSVRRSALTAT